MSKKTKKITNKEVVALLRSLGDIIASYRQKCPTTDARSLQALDYYETTLSMYADSYQVQSAASSLITLSNAMEDIQGAVDDAKDALEKIQGIIKGVNLAGSIATLGLAIYKGNATGIGTAVQGILDSLAAN